jgi:hypothetical protein
MSWLANSTHYDYIESMPPIIKQLEHYSVDRWSDWLFAGLRDYVRDSFNLMSFGDARTWMHWDLPAEEMLARFIRDFSGSTHIRFECAIANTIERLSPSDDPVLSAENAEALCILISLGSILKSPSVLDVLASGSLFDRNRGWQSTPHATTILRRIAMAAEQSAAITDGERVCKIVSLVAVHIEVVPLTEHTRIFEMLVRALARAFRSELNRNLIENTSLIQFSTCYTREVNRTDGIWESVIWPAINADMGVELLAPLPHDQPLELNDVESELVRSNLAFMRANHFDRNFNKRYSSNVTVVILGAGMHALRRVTQSIFIQCEKHINGAAPSADLLTKFERQEIYA